MVRGPLASMAWRSEPGSESFRFVTSNTLPPRPPMVYFPKPSAPGKAGIFDFGDECAVSGAEQPRQEMIATIKIALRYIKFLLKIKL